MTGLTEQQNARLECLHLAGKACGDDVSYTYVLEAARKYFDFVMDRKADLKIVTPEACNDERGV